MKIKLKDYNLLDYSVWTPTGTTGSIGQFNQVATSSSNSRILSADPFGYSTSVWRGVTNLSGSDKVAGYTTTLLPVDITKTYRSTVWIKKVDGTTTENIYHGVRTYNAGGTQQPTIDISTGTNAVNSYFSIMSNGVVSGYTQNEWRLYVGYIYPASWTGTTDNVKTGTLKPDGTNLGLGVSYVGKGDLKFSATTTQMYQIILSPYSISATISGLTTYACYPRLDVVDGTEPSITTLLTSEGPFREVSNVMIKNDTNLISYNDWVNGNTGSTNKMFAYSLGTTNTYNGIVNDTNPFGITSPVWVAKSGSTQNGNVFGGYNMDVPGNQLNSLVNIDNTKDYRFSVWVNRKLTGHTTDSLYFGTRVGSGATYTNCKRYDNVVTATTNPYFIGSAAVSTLIPQNSWRLLVGTLFNKNKLTGATLGTYTGIYKPDGSKDTTLSNDWIMSGDTYLTCIRLSTPYNTSGWTVSENCYPRIDLIDGTEPSIATLLAGEGPWRNVVGGSVNISGTWKTITGTTF